MTYVITFIFGAMVGACVGIVVIGLMIAGKEDDREQTTNE